MAFRAPISDLPTHQVSNQPPPFADLNLFEIDRPMQEALAREGGQAFLKKVRDLGAVMGSAAAFEQADAANKAKPQLQTFDRYGRRVDEVTFHPAYHWLMETGISHGIPAIAWTAGSGGHVAHTALEYVFAQVEGGVCCPLTMTYAAVPLLRRVPELDAVWTPKVLSGRYDPRLVPVAEKQGATIGMAMTEKQGGSDVRSNETRAEPAGDGWYRLTGHKWFCSAPMSDAFFTLARTEHGLSCFFLPRWRPDGTRNPFFIQRLKDKLGNWSNASAEIEYAGSLALLVGEEGRGLQTIIEMVHHTRLDTAMAPTALMRQALVQAIHHARHRIAFQRRLVDQPMMRRVLADLALEVEGAVALLMRTARGYDEAAAGDGDAARFARLAVSLAKYHINRQCPHFVYEALECLGGNGYVEENIMPRLYREAPLNSIWEGSGNVICLDLLRAVGKDPTVLDLYFAELRAARGGSRLLDRAVDALEETWRATPGEGAARRLAERMAVALQASLLVRHAPAEIADAFAATRLDADARGRAYGAHEARIDEDMILSRALPA